MIKLNAIPHAQTIIPDQVTRSLVPAFSPSDRVRDVRVKLETRPAIAAFTRRWNRIEGAG